LLEYKAKPPLLSNSFPVIAGTRIPTESIAWFVSNGYSLESVLEDFPRLTPEDVKAAVVFESGHEVVTPELVSAHT
jgi:uncharacterized protein (DUF433 family)